MQRLGAREERAMVAATLAAARGLASPQTQRKVA